MRGMALTMKNKITIKVNKPIILALFGKSGAGKDSIKKYILNNMENTKNIIPFTTRPRRDYETNGIDYYFLLEEEFKERINTGSIIEYAVFNNWYYGTSLDGLSTEQINVGAFSISDIQQLLKVNCVIVIPVYVAAPDHIRLQRLLWREQEPNCHEICRRFFTDEEDFKNIDFEYSIINNNSNTLFPKGELENLWATLINDIS